VRCGEVTVLVLEGGLFQGPRLLETVGSMGGKLKCSLGFSLYHKCMNGPNTIQ
jgi:hypothetical protein